MTKKRKSLDDSLANDFVFGKDRSETEETTAEEVKSVEKASTPNAPIKPKSDDKPNQKSNLMEKLQVEAKEGTKRFTIDLRESVHRKLSILAAKTGRTKADIVRMLLDDALEDVDQ